MSTQKTTITGRFDADTVEEFEEYRSERDLNKSTAVRRLVQRGLAAEHQESEDDRGFAGKVTAVDLVILGAIVILAEAVGLWAYVGLAAYALALFAAHRLDS
jgi:curli biogenesis system outer membrane secretion channel CsgG